jgi:hypothetical protein
MRRSIIAAVLIAVAVGSYYLVATKPRDPAVAVGSEPNEEPAREVEPSPATSDASVTLDPPSRSPEQRSEAIKNLMRRSMGTARDGYVEELMAKGLARPDSERIVDEFTAGIADCVFEAARVDYESRGYTLDEFLRGAEMLWSHGSPEIDPQHLRNAVACAANVSQQAGLAVPFDTPDVRSSEPTDVPADWAQAHEMEATIRRHIASHAELAVRDLFVHCEARGCEILMQGPDIRIFDLEFDRFAEQNGFRNAVLGGNARLRSVWLQR